MNTEALKKNPLGKNRNYKKDLQWDPKVEDLLEIGAVFLTELNINITKKVCGFETLIATSKIEAEEIAKQKGSYLYPVFVHINKSRWAKFIWYGIPN